MMALLVLAMYLQTEYFATCTGVAASSCESQMMALKLLALLPDCDRITVASSASSPVVQYPDNLNRSNCLEFRASFNHIVERINNSSELLPYHELKPIYKHDGCNNKAGEIAESLVTGLFPQDTSKVVGVIGPACAESAVKVARITSQPDIGLVVLNNVGSTVLEKYRNSIGITGSTRFLIDLSLALIDTSGWQNLCILYESSQLHFRDMKDWFLNKLTQRNMRVATTELPVFSNYYPFNELRTSRVRVVLTFASLEHSRRILCMAYHRGIIYPTYQWVFLSHAFSDFVLIHSPKLLRFIQNGTQYECSDTHLLSALENSFLVVFPQLESAITKANAFYGNLNFRDILNVTPPQWAYGFYEAVWTWTIVLHNLISNHEVTFNYGNTSLTDVILKQFYNGTFEGVSGQISFSSRSSTVNRKTTLYQIRKGRQTVIGTRNATVTTVLPSFISIPDYVKDVDLPGGGYIGVFIALTGLELIAIIILHVLTFNYRKAKSVKANSTKLIQLAFIGGYTFILTIMLNCISWLFDFGPKADAVLCQIIWAWSLPLSFTLVVGVVAVRTWRLYRIFVHYLNPGKFISNSALITAVIMLASVDIINAVTWTFVDPIQFRYVEITKTNGTEFDVLLDPQCYYNIWWLILIFLYKIAMLLALIVLTVLTRKISRFNATVGTKYIQMFTYSFSVVFVIGFTLYYIFAFISHDIYAEFITLSALLNTLLLVFVTFIILPPLVPVFHKKSHV